jgi:hypothetical protein
LATVILPKYRLIWGGHPSITPMIYYVMTRFGLDIKQNVTLYQSKYFERDFPVDNDKIENVILTPNLFDPDLSLSFMRNRMFSENTFSAGVFIGGMNGIEEEFELFRKSHPDALVLPIASTGAAAKIVYDKYLPLKMQNDRLVNDYAYMSLFQDLLIDKM